LVVFIVVSTKNIYFIFKLSHVYSKYRFNGKVTDFRKNIIAILLIMFTLDILLPYFLSGITQSATAQPSTNNFTNGSNQTNKSNDVSVNSKCNNPAIATTNSSELKVRVLPPKIVMNYAGKEYQGELSVSKFRGGETISELHVPPKNVTANLPSKMVQIERISCVQFVIEGTPGILPPSSLAVTAYTNNNGTAVKVLSAVNSQSTVFRVTLEKGAYILLAAATWLPGREHVSGYVIYKFIVKVV
jgi:hypothetical protein